jgi:hypothetical protein
VVHEVASVPAVQVQRDLAVALGLEAISLRDQPVADGAIAVELPVDDQGQIAAGADDGLPAIVEPDDGQSGVPEHRAPIRGSPLTSPVWAAMGKRVERAVDVREAEPRPNGPCGKEPTHAHLPSRQPHFGARATDQSYNMIRENVGGNVW